MLWLASCTDLWSAGLDHHLSLPTRYSAPPAKPVTSRVSFEHNAWYIATHSALQKPFKLHLILAGNRSVAFQKVTVRPLPTLLLHTATLDVINVLYYWVVLGSSKQWALMHAQTKSSSQQSRHKAMAKPASHVDGRPGMQTAIDACKSALQHVTAACALWLGVGSAVAVCSAVAVFWDHC